VRHGAGPKSVVSPANDKTVAYDVLIHVRLRPSLEVVEQLSLHRTLLPFVIHGNEAGNEVVSDVRSTQATNTLHDSRVVTALRELDWRAQRREWPCLGVAPSC
jgi:hypothetical protein